ncbi:Glycoside hydrolase family 71 [Penicillium samsonianum]|uniref:Glycoside hydrolase family 71 n=1 Tax=Penicillium samsonianum TaxID=1882272 RepID=UPI002548DF21|nr:Glycoside hydrolase family 71 [Penicillium samsonianum]KAJ6118778.1 Glycoside hydrolase family 71 [Penicillium samsonianum]
MASSLPIEYTSEENHGNRLVFCHFMVGIVSNRLDASDYDDDMKRAKYAGIDAFALNIGTDSYTDTQLDFAYESASNNGMKVFISFDFNWWQISQGSAVGAKIAQYANLPGQLKVDGKVFTSSFAGDGVDIDAIRSAARSDIYFAPNFHPGRGDFDNVQAALSWIAWDNNGNNKCRTPYTVADGDNSYKAVLKGKPYVASVSPWFSTHFGGEVSLAKNWVFPSGLLWYKRWRETLETSPRFVELISWNDYGESHYIGPLSSPHIDDGSSKWVIGMPHNGWLDMAKPFISAYKAGSKLPLEFLDEEKLIYWYRPTPKDVNCDATDTSMQGNPNSRSGDFVRARPDGADDMTDAVFIVTLLKTPAMVHVQSGRKTEAYEAKAGVWSHSVPMGVGAQRFKVTREGMTVDSLCGTSLRDIVHTCPCGIYNFNAYVGTLPAEASADQLQSAGLTRLLQGLQAPCPTSTLVAGTV